METLLERDQLGRGTSHVAAGMLAPVTEVEFGEAGRRVLALGLRSASMWPAFAEQLQAASGIEVGLRQTGTLLLARDDDEARELDRQIAFRESLGLRAERLRASEARALEPAIAPTIRLALRAPEDHSVDPRPVLGALRLACEAAGVTLREHTPVARIETDGGGERVRGVMVQEGGASPDAFIAAERVLIAAGPWVERHRGPAGARAGAGAPGQGSDPAVARSGGAGHARRGWCDLRAATSSRAGMVATCSERRSRSAASTWLRRWAESTSCCGTLTRWFPGVSELEIEELSVGLRPGTPDNAPAIGTGALEGLGWATGHHRNGILLAPVTAALALEALTGGEAIAQQRGAHGRRRPLQAARRSRAARPSRAVRR